jgi:aryl-alcohol dehydrogenase-like predicted oxidoreductase
MEFSQWLHTHFAVRQFSADSVPTKTIISIIATTARRAQSSKNSQPLAQGAIAWIWARSDKTLPIPGIRTVAQAVENARAMDYGPLTPDQMQEIDRLLGRTSPEQEE